MLQSIQGPDSAEPVTINIADIGNIYNIRLPMPVKLNNLWVSTISKCSDIMLRDRTGRSIQLKHYGSIPYLWSGCRINITAALYPNDNKHLFLDYAESIEMLSHSYITSLKPGHLSAAKSGSIKVSFKVSGLSIPIYEENVSLIIDDTPASVFLEGSRFSSIISLTQEGIHTVRAEIKKSGMPTLVKRWSFTVYDSSQHLNIYTGVPHAHTGYSDGKGTPTTACLHAMKRNLDFIFITDHSHRLDGVIQRCFEYAPELGEYVEAQGSQWYKTRCQIDEINGLDRNFTALRGFEMSSGLGHLNVLNTSSYIEGKVHMSKTEDFLKWLLVHENAVVSVNHPENPKALYSDSLSEYQKDLDGILSLIEAGNGTPSTGYVRYEEAYYEGLDKGWHWGVLNSQDNHTDDWGDHTNFTGILSHSLTPGDIVFALKNRNTYSTETGTLKMRYSAEDFPMGSIIELPEGKKVVMDISARDEKYPIRKLELISNRGKSVDEKYFSDMHCVKWNPQIKVQGSERWYVLKVTHSNDAWGLSSPIFIRPDK